MEELSFNDAVEVANSDISTFIIEYRRILFMAARKRGIEIDLVLSEEEMTLIEDQYLNRVVAIVEGEHDGLVGLVSGIKIKNDQLLFYLDDDLPWLPKSILKFGQKWIEEYED